MKLTPTEILALGQNLLDDAKALQADADKAMAALNSHNSEKGVTPVNGGPLSVVRGTAGTIVEQIQKHIAENTLVAPKLPSEGGPAPPAPAAPAATSPAKS